MRTLQAFDVRGLRAFAVLSRLDLEADALPLLEVAVACTFDRAEMHEHIGLTFNREKPEAFFCVEPFDDTLWHTLLLPPHPAGTVGESRYLPCDASSPEASSLGPEPENANTSPKRDALKLHLEPGRTNLGQQISG